MNPSEINGLGVYELDKSYWVIGDYGYVIRRGFKSEAEAREVLNKEYLDLDEGN